MAEQSHWSEPGRAASVANADALGRPRRSVLSFGVSVRVLDKLPARRIVKP